MSQEPCNPPTVGWSRVRLPAQHEVCFSLQPLSSPSSSVFSLSLSLIKSFKKKNLLSDKIKLAFVIYNKPLLNHTCASVNEVAFGKPLGNLRGLPGEPTKIKRLEISREGLQAESIIYGQWLNQSCLSTGAFIKTPKDRVWRASGWANTRSGTGRVAHVCGGRASSEPLHHPSCAPPSCGSSSV